MSQSREVLKAINTANKNAEAAGRNEEITRGRVESLERIVGGFLSLPFRHRLKWLFFGMPPAPNGRQPVVSADVSEQEAADVH